MVYATLKFVAVCTRVAWFSQKSGCSYAHPLPEVSANTDTQCNTQCKYTGNADLFDSVSGDASNVEEFIEVQAMD